MGKITDEYNFSALIFLSFSDFNPFISVNVNCWVFNIKDKKSPSSFEAMLNNKANFFNSSIILTLLNSFSFKWHILLIKLQ